MWTRRRAFMYTALYNNGVSLEVVIALHPHVNHFYRTPFGSIRCLRVGALTEKERKMVDDGKMERERKKGIVLLQLVQPNPAVMQLLLYQTV